MRGVIVCNGSIRDYGHMRKYLEGADLIICADGGARHLQRMGVKPHILAGDFDSITAEEFSRFRDDGVEIFRYPPEKDMTDTEIAVDLAADRGCTSVTLIAAMGTRFDHSLSNVFLLKKMLEKGIFGLIADERNEIMLIDNHIRLDREEGMKVTLLPLTGTAYGVTTRGLYYPLHNAAMPLGSSWGVSNEFSEPSAEISITGGLLLVVKSRD